MKKYSVVIFLLAIFLASCNTDRSIDPTVMPEESAIGAQTFGCLVDGWLYIGGRYSKLYGTFDPQGSIQFIYDAVSNNMNVEVKVKAKGKTYEYIAFTINNPIKGENCTFTNARWLDKENNLDIALGNGTGTVEIIQFDKSEKVFSGRFYSGNKNGDGIITHGQFDVKYQ